MFAGAKIVEKENGSVASTKQFIWGPRDAQPCEERDGSNTVTKRFYAQGMQVGSTNYYYTKDHLGSIRELTDSSGVVQTRYDYEPYGRRTKLSGSVDADFGFTGHYYHAPTGLHLALYRAYDADLERWISRDPIGEVGGVNLYGYVFNNPVNEVDPFGLLDWREVYEHYIGGTRTPLRMSFSDIDTSTVRPSQFPQVQKEIQGSTTPRTAQIDDKKAFTTSGDQSLFLGHITLRLQGEFKVDPCLTWKFNGTLKSYDDIYDFNAAHRGILGELLTAFGRSTPGTPFDIQIRGAKQISETGKMGQ